MEDIWSQMFVLPWTDFKLIVSLLTLMEPLPLQLVVPLYHFSLNDHLFSDCTKLRQLNQCYLYLVPEVMTIAVPLQAHHQNSGTLQPFTLKTIGAFWLPRISAFFPPCTPLPLQILSPWTPADPNTWTLLTLHSALHVPCWPCYPQLPIFC